MAFRCCLYSKQWHKKDFQAVYVIDSNSQDPQRAAQKASGGSL